MPKPILYSTLGCHLCECAQALLAAAGYAAPADLEVVEIADDPALVERYGVRIPVLRVAGAGELGWPFSAVELERFLNAAGAAPKA